MGRAPCCDKEGLKRGPWTAEEDKILIDYIQSHGHGSWRSLPKLAGLLRCGKSCRLRWTNYLRPDIKRGPFTPEEQKSIIQLHGIVGNKWSAIAAQLPGRTDNEIKNYWNTHLKKRLLKMGIDPETHSNSNTISSSPSSAITSATAASPAATPSCSATRHMAQWESARLEAEARLSKESLLLSNSSVAAADVDFVPSGKTKTSPTPKAEAPDFFLRIWNSEVGDAFRCRAAAAAAASSSPASSTTKYKECNNGDERKEEVECKSMVTTGGDAVGAYSSSSNEVAVPEDDAAEESYKLYLDFAAGDDMVMASIFHGHHLGSFSMFDGYLTEASFDTTFD